MKRKNLYNLLSKSFLPKVLENKADYDESTIEAVDAIEKYCNDNFKQYFKKPEEVKEKTNETNNPPIV